jgi:hypothetical protein
MNTNLNSIKNTYQKILKYTVTKQHLNKEKKPELTKIY